MAEILITLGIIGIVAALTMPSLIQNHRNHVVATRLKAAYSEINQAIALAEIDYGDRTLWYNTSDVDFDKNGKPVSGSAPRIKWINKYLIPYLKVVKTERFDTNNYPIFYLANGTAIQAAHQTSLADWNVYTASPEKCKKYDRRRGKCAFMFNYMPSNTKSGWHRYLGRNFEPYKYNYNGTRTSLYNNCKNSIYGEYCATLIQYEGWKIPKDYPFKVVY